MSLEIIIGPMFSGKSTYLVGRLRASRRVKTIYINSAKDTRAKKVLSVRNALVEEENFPEATFVKAEKLADVDVSKFTVVLVDEAQFFDDLVTFVWTCLKLKKRIVISGLNGSFAAEPFGHIHELLPMANEVHIIKAVCSCGADALFSKKKVSSDQLLQIGDDELYEPKCLDCFTVCDSNNNTSDGNGDDN